MIREEDGISKTLQRLKVLTGAEAELEEMEITRFIVDSALYAVESRCGVTDGELDFSLISRYQNEEILYRAGRLASHLSGKVLFEISKTMKTIDLERSAYYGRDYRNSVQGSGRPSISRIGGNHERGNGNGNTGQVRQDGSQRPAGERSGPVRDDASVGNASSENAGGTGAGGNAARRDRGETGTGMDGTGQRESIRYHENDGPADTGRDGSRGRSNQGSHSSDEITKTQQQEDMPQEEQKQEEGTALAVPFALSDIQPGEVTEEMKRLILLEMTDDETKQAVYLFFANNPDSEERREYLHEVYGDDEVRKESKESFLSYEGGRDGFYLLWAQEDSMYEGYWPWEYVCESIEKLIRERNYLPLESISDAAIDEEDTEAYVEDTEREPEAVEEKPDELERLKVKILDIGEAFYGHKSSVDVLNQMICRIYSTNLTGEEKAAFLKNVLTQYGEVPQSYHAARLDNEFYEFQIQEDGVSISRADDPEEEFTNIQFDWEEFGDLTAHLAEEDRIPYSEDLETIKKQQKMYQMLPWFVKLQNAYVQLLEKEEQEFLSGELQQMVENGAFEVPANPYHDAVRKAAAREFVESSMAIVPYQALVYNFFGLNITQRAKAEFIQCLLLEVNQYHEVAFPEGEVPVNLQVEDSLISISYMDQEGNQFEQLLSYMEIAAEIQEAIERGSFLTPEEYELGKMDGYAFCGETAIGLFEEFSHKAFQEPPDRTGGVQPGEEVIPKAAGEENPEESKTEETEPDEPKETDTIAEEPSGEPADFYFPEGWKLPEGGSKTRYQCNVAAIRTLRVLEQEGRPATAKEQEILAGYVGWGGLANAFNARNVTWKKEYKELKELLDEKEYNQARQSVTTSFYTPPEIIQGIYHGLRQFGFKKGKILEPAMGIGNFFHGLPQEMRESELYGVELDSISGRIAKYLHPSANIQVKGFESTEFSDNSFDIVIGNVPFGDFKVYDPRYKKKKLKIHDYFVTKSLDLLRPGGILAVITSKGTLDKKDNFMRKELAEQAQLLGAIRLPGKSFSKDANTDVTSDILFFRKKPERTVEETIWTFTGLTEDDVPVNEYFLEHPEMMLGKMVFDEKMFGKGSNYTALVNEEPDFNLSERLLCAVEELPKNVYQEGELTAKQEKRDRIDADPDVPNFTFTVHQDEVYYREGSYMYRYQGKESMKRRIRGMHKIRLLVREIMEMQTRDCTDEELKEAQLHLNKLYDAFVKTHGHFSDRTNKSAFRLHQHLVYNQRQKPMPS